MHEEQLNVRDVYMGVEEYMSSALYSLGSCVGCVKKQATNLYKHITQKKLSGFEAYQVMFPNDTLSRIRYSEIAGMYYKQFKHYTPTDQALTVKRHVDEGRSIDNLVDSEKSATYHMH